MLGGLKSFSRRILHAVGEPFRVTAFSVQRDRELKSRTRIISRYLDALGEKKLHLGCGRNIMPGWLNTDIYTTQGSDVCFVDATVPLPFNDQSFNYAYTEHMIEHIPYESGLFLIGECFRVLKPGGVLRVATPNLQRILSLYDPTPTDAARRYMDWSMQRHMPTLGPATPAFVINNFFDSWGHRFIYDPNALKNAFTKVGFTDVSQQDVSQSQHSSLRGVEAHGKDIGSEEMNLFETLIVEGKKPTGH